MYKRCTTEKGTAQQKQLEQTLLSWMLNTPYEDISVRGLCVKADVSRKTFYRLFDSKDDVLNALIDHTLLDYVTYHDMSIKEQDPAKRELQNFFSFWYSQKLLLDALFVNNKVNRIVERSIEHVLSNDSHTLKFYGATNPKYAREIIVYHVSSCMNLMLAWRYYGYEKSIEEMSELLYQLLTSSPAQIPID